MALCQEGSEHSQSDDGSLVMLELAIELILRHMSREEASALEERYLPNQHCLDS